MNKEDSGSSSDRVGPKVRERKRIPADQRSDAMKDRGKPGENSQEKTSLRMRKPTKISGEDDQKRKGKRFKISDEEEKGLTISREIYSKDTGTKMSEETDKKTGKIEFSAETVPKTKGGVKINKEIEQKRGRIEFSGETLQKAKDGKYSEETYQKGGKGTKSSGDESKYSEETYQKGKGKGKKVSEEYDGPEVKVEVSAEMKKSKGRLQKKIREDESDEKTVEKKRKVKSPKANKDREAPKSGMPRTVELSKKNKEFYDERKWPEGVVRYTIIDPGDVDIEDVRARLEEVNQILKRRTCTSLVELTEEQAENYEDYLVLDSSPDYVTGRVGGKQNFGVVELFKGGQHRQHAAMMAMAMLGFYFEVSRHDRDKYIRVHMRHVRPDKLHHFEKIREDATFALPYDYQSATHPAWQFWRQIGKTGISTVATFKETDPDGAIMKSLGQNQQLLSELDLVKINSVYGTNCFLKGKPKGKKEKQDAEEPEIEEDEMVNNMEEDDSR